MSFEKVVFGNLIFREDYGRKVIPFLKSEYFTDIVDRALFELIEVYVQKYNRFPTKESLVVDLDSVKGIGDEQYKAIVDNIAELEFDPKTELEWLVEKTEKFCQEKAVYNAIMRSIQIIDNKDQKAGKGSIPGILSEALAISFDTNIGHSFLEDAEARYEYYHRTEHRIPFNIDFFNKITKGGLPRKTLNICLASTGTGKSLFMCHVAAGNLVDGKNVLYITLEMAEEEIAKRIDANLLDITMDELEIIPKDSYERKIAKLNSKTNGKLIIKEYPTSSASSANFRHLLNELKLKKNFVPDIIYIDYLNICSSARVKLNSNVNSYTYVKSIAEELRGLAVEYNVPIMSATQTNRCLSLDTIVYKNGNEPVRIDSLQEGDLIQGSTDLVLVNKVYNQTSKETYEIKTKSGKTIICSGNHIFPTDNGNKTIYGRLTVGDNLYTKVV